MSFQLRLAIARELGEMARPLRSRFGSAVPKGFGSRGDLGRVALPALRKGRNERPRDDEEHGLPRARKGKHVGEARGFTIHAGVAIAKGNSLERELLSRS
jgi:hypothetical protein